MKRKERNWCFQTDCTYLRGFFIRWNCPTYGSRRFPAKGETWRSEWGFGRWQTCFFRTWHPSFDYPPRPTPSYYHFLCEDEPAAYDSFLLPTLPQAYHIPRPSRVVLPKPGGRRSLTFTSLRSIQLKISSRKISATLERRCQFSRHPRF